MNMKRIEKGLMYLLKINAIEPTDRDSTIPHANGTPKGAKPTLFKNKFPKSFTSLSVKIPCKLWDKKRIARAIRKIIVLLFFMLFDGII
mgnify:FL=1